MSDAGATRVAHTRLTIVHVIRRTVATDSKFSSRDGIFASFNCRPVTCQHCLGFKFIHRRADCAASHQNQCQHTQDLHDPNLHVRMTCAYVLLILVWTGEGGESVRRYRHSTQTSSRLAFGQQSTDHVRANRTFVVEIKQRSRHNAAIVTAVTLKNRKPEVLEQIAR